MRSLLSILLLLTFTSTLTLTSAHNITKILAKYPDFSTFNHYLTSTHLASQINSRLTITVLAVDNAGMASLLSKHLSPSTLKNVLLLHILVDYYGAKKLHQLTGGSTTSSSMFQATGAAPGTTGFVNITDHRAGRVTFAAQDADASSSPATFVKTVKELPYNISVIQISTTLSSPEAEAPAAAPAPVNITESMSAKGCKLFADMLEANPDVLAMYQANVDSGLSVFCPIDKAVTSFAPKYHNLTAANKTELLLFHGVPVYFSLQMLKTNNGIINTLASDGHSKRYRFTVQNAGEVVNVETKVVTASITTTVVDQDQMAIYAVNKVLQPKELFKAAKGEEEDADAPAPAPAAPKKKKKLHKGAASPPEPAGPEESPADEKAADDNAGVRVAGAWAAMAVAAVVAVLV